MSTEATMKTQHRALRALALAVLLALGPSAEAADDTALFSNQVAPNVMLIVDNSISMKEIVWHPAYNPDLFWSATCSTDPEDPDYDENCLEYPLCPITPGDSEFTAGATNDWPLFGQMETESGITVNKSDNHTDCNDRTVFADSVLDGEGVRTTWSEHYLEWYFSDNVNLDHDGNGTTILQEIVDTNDGVNSSCVGGGTYPLYQRARITAARQVLREVICNTSLVASIRYGLAKFMPLSSGETTGGYVVVEIDDYDSAQDLALDTAIGNVDGETYTPLAETLFYVYRYFMSRDSTKTAYGVDDDYRFPVYNRNLTGGTSGTIPGSPLTSDCQQHFVVYITDGEPTLDDFDNMNLSDFQNRYIGDYNSYPGDEVEIPGNFLEQGFYLDDIAKFMHENDFAPGTDYPGMQTIDVYTVGFSTNAAANDLLDRTADVGGGSFYSSNNPEELTQAIVSVISDIVAKSHAFTAATVPASRATDGNNFFSSYFTPSRVDPLWAGHLKLFDFGADGSIKDAPPPDGTGECALDYPLAPTRCRVGGLKLGLAGFWDAGAEIPAPGSRSLYVSKYQSAAPTGVPVVPPAFTDTGTGKLTPSDLGIAGVSAATINTWNIGATGWNFTGIDTDTELADAITGYIKGCEFDNSGTCTDRGDFRKLWDIFHSNPVVVGPPNSGLREKTYRSFVQTYKHRTRVIYAGSNGGFVHGFNAGDWDATAGTYDRGTGAEEFGFMAYPARQKIALRAKDLWPRGETGWSGFTMDGSPTAADVWFYGSATDSPDATGNTWQKWRTVLLGGLRQGGNVVWALDVSDPDGVTGNPTMYPGYLWEFPCEATACDSWRAYMGETWSQPVVTRIKATVDCGDASGDDDDLLDNLGDPCPTYDRWVAIFGGGYSTAGDPNLTHDSALPLTAGQYDATNTTGSSTAGRSVFMVDIVTGEVLASKRYDPAATTTEGQMRFAVAASPSVFDADFDGYGDIVYIPDLGGNVFKWVISDPAQDHINGTEGDDDQARWPFVKLFQAESCQSPDCTAPHYKSFYYPPTGSRVGQSLWIAVGSGERNDLNWGRDGGLADEALNRFYVIKDTDPFESERDPADLPLVDADLAVGEDLTDTNPKTCLASDESGFYFTGDQGEKFITDSVIFFGVVFTASYVPDPSSVNPCVANGTAYLWAFDLMCGQGKLPNPSGDPDDPDVRRVEVGDGLPNSPRVSVGPTNEDSGDPDDPDNCKDMVIMITSENGGYSEGRCERQVSGAGIHTWRDQ
jgi:type IV pilus assembly protein PilY1